MNSLTENMLTTSDPQITNNAQYTKSQGKIVLGMKNKNDNQDGDKFAVVLKGDETKDSKSGTLINPQNNEIIKQHGMCEYNIALSILGETIIKVKGIIDKNYPVKAKTPEVNLYVDQYQTFNDNYSQNSNSANELKSEFVMTKLYLNDQVKMCGLFKRNVPLSVIFAFGARIFNVPKEYILLKEIGSSDVPTIQNFNFDQNKKINEIMEDQDLNKMSFELMLNIKKYGEVMSNNILQKFLENYDLEESQLKKDFEKKHMKTLFHAIFSEINSFDTVHPTYGKLFKKIRKTILMKIGLMTDSKA